MPFAFIPNLFCCFFFLHLGKGINIPRVHPVFKSIDFRYCKKRRQRQQNSADNKIVILKRKHKSKLNSSEIHINGSDEEKRHSLKECNHSKKREQAQRKRRVYCGKVCRNCLLLFEFDEWENCRKNRNQSTCLAVVLHMKWIMPDQQQQQQPRWTLQFSCVYTDDSNTTKSAIISNSIVIFSSIFHLLSNTRSDYKEFILFHWKFRFLFFISISKGFSSKRRKYIFFILMSRVCYSLCIVCFIKFVFEFNVIAINCVFSSTVTAFSRLLLNKHDCECKRKVCHRFSCIMTRNLWPIQPMANVLLPTFILINTLMYIAHGIPSLIACLNFTKQLVPRARACFFIHFGIFISCQQLLEFMIFFALFNEIACDFITLIPWYRIDTVVFTKI